MQEIIDFLNTNNLSLNKAFKRLDCTLDEGKIMQEITKSFFNGFASINAYSLLQNLWPGYEYLDKIKLLQSLQNKDLIKSSPASEELLLLQADLSLTKNALNILENKISKLRLNKSPFKSQNEYLNLEFIRLDLIQSIAKIKDKKQLCKLKNKLNKLSLNIKYKLSLSEQNPIQELFKENDLCKEERAIFLALLRQEYTLNAQIKDAKTLLCYCDGNPAFLQDNAKLLACNIVEYEEYFNNTFQKTYFLSQEVIQRVLSPQKKLKSKLKSLLSEQEIFELIEPKQSFKDLILPKNITDILENIIKQGDAKVASKLRSWGLNFKEGIQAKLIFYGSAGTGKTMSALALAKALKRPLLNFDCSKILSKYVGESEQNVRQVFDEYKKISQQSGCTPVLLLNEADQFLSSRSPGDSGSLKMHNQMQNIFLEQIERFDGILIATTNFLESLDLAFSRRFEYKIEFKPPDFAQRKALWKLYLPKKAPLKGKLNIDLLADYVLSGAQIELVIKNAALNAASCDLEFCNELFIKYILKEQNSSFDKSKTLGFLQA